MIKCYQNNECLLASAAKGEKVCIPLSVCERYCSPTDQAKQLRKLRKKDGVDIPNPPEGVDLLDWINQCVDNGTINISERAKQDHEAKNQKQAEINKATQEIIDYLNSLPGVAEMPGMIKRVETLGRHALEVNRHRKETGRMWVSEEIHDARMTVCESCKFRIEKDGTLWCGGGCGCKLSGDLGKSWFEILNCEKGAWPK
jgi:hypothetical protein